MVVSPGRVLQGFRLASTEDPVYLIDLEIVDQTALARRELPTPMRDLTANAAGLQFLRVNLRPSSKLRRSHKRFCLYHLDHDELGTNKNSVCVIRHEWEELKFIYVADIHLAAMWNEVHSKIQERPKRARLPTDGRIGAERLLARESLQPGFPL